MGNVGAFEHKGVKSPAGWKAHAFRDIIDGQRCGYPNRSRDRFGKIGATPMSGGDLQFVEQPSSTAANFWNSSAMHRYLEVHVGVARMKRYFCAQQRFFW